MTREEILKEALRCVTGEREQQYGRPEDNFSLIANFWTNYLKTGCVTDDGAVYICADDVAAMMALLKIARICAGAGKADNWVDLAGYAACGGAIQAARGDGQARVKAMMDEPKETEEDRKRAEKLKAVKICCEENSCEASHCPVITRLVNPPCGEKELEEMTLDELEKMLECFEARDEEGTDEQS